MIDEMTAKRVVDELISAQMTLNPRTSNLYWNDANFHEAVHLLQNNLIQVMRVLADYVGRNEHPTTTLLSTLLFCFPW